MDITGITELVRTRHTCKAFDPSRKIPAQLIEQLRDVLRHSPSSVNSQPWHFVLAGTEAGKARIATATQPAFPYNEQKILKASHVVVLCSRVDLDDAYLATLLAREEEDGRIRTAEARTAQCNTRNHYVNLHRYDRKDLQHWMEKQVFIALGSLLLGAAALGIDACPMEGFDPRRLDEELGLRSRGLTSLIVVSLGYRGTDDFNASQHKSRLPEASIFTEI